MLDLFPTVLAGDLAIAAALATVLGATAVAQGAYRAAAEALRGTPLLTWTEAAAAVRAPAPHAAELVGSGQ